MMETLDRVEELARQLEIARRALFQAQEAAKALNTENRRLLALVPANAIAWQQRAIEAENLDLCRSNIIGRIACAALGAKNNVSDGAVVDAVERLAAVRKAAQALADEAQEYAMDFGLGCAAPLDLWQELWSALDSDKNT
jgi:hypothetical protein